MYPSEPVRNEIVAVGVTSVSLTIDQQGRRKMIYIRNTSDAAQVITVSLGKTAVANQGFLLNVGDYIIDSRSELYEPYQGVITAISTAAAGQISIVER